MITLKIYQEKAIKELTEKTEILLGHDMRAIISFKAPTGSGKTLMVAEALKTLVSDVTLNSLLSFVWISVRRLHEQSKDKLEKYLHDSNSLKCSYFADLQDLKIGQNEILFINWESISRKNVNILVRENEQDNNLNSIIRNTKDEGRKIILIIDESHHTANSERSRELIDIIAPEVTIEVSATPIQKFYDEQVSVYLTDVKAEQMIKSEISVNPEFMGMKINTKSSDELIIDQALKKRELLASKYKLEGSNINPLLLIQLPDRRSELDEKKDEIVKLLDSRFNINEGNGKLAIWLSEEKSESLVNIDKPNNEVEVLIFKQAISLGWDCPRASILIIFREMKSFTFTIQTVGRIMRMPEFRYYTSGELNVGYIYTNLPNIIIEGNELSDFITLNESRKDKKRYTNISIKSVWVKRIRERTRLSGEFVRIFQKTAIDMDLKRYLNPSPEKISDFIIADGKITNIDQLGEIEKRGFISIGSRPMEINRKFDLFIWSVCSPYAPADSSDRLKSAIYTFLKDNLGVEKYSELAQTIVLGANNINLFSDAIQKSKDIYQKDIVEKLNQKGEFIENENWEIPDLISYNEKYFIFSSKKSIVQPFYQYKNASIPEKNFEKFLDNNDHVEWWFKNRESEPKYFAVGYKDENNYNRAFYVDFIVKFADGTIGLYDTKQGQTASVDAAKIKAEALQDYIKNENRNGKHIKGGIVIPSSYAPSISWKINSNAIYTDDFDNLKNWKILVIS